MNIYEVIGAMAVTIGVMTIPTYCYRAFTEDWNIIAKCGLVLGVILEAVLLFITVIENASNKHKKR